jgi:citrate lyase subunit beta/citryl-CoA lyase
VTKRKSDCEVAYAAGGGELRVRVDSSVGVLFGRAIERTAREAAAEFGVGSGELRVDDDGALDYAVAARVEAALRAAGFARVGPARAAGNAPAAPRRPIPWRSRLYLPGDQPDLFPNAGLFGADCLILDLEDSVMPSRKAEARILARRVLEAHRGFFGRSALVVRVNPLAGPFGRDDVAELGACLPDAILLPKCESPADVEALASELDSLESTARGGGRALIMALVETARGVVAAPSIAAASDRVCAVCFGAEDFSRDVGARRTAGGAEASLARQSVVLAAKAAGVQAHDSVYSDSDDDAGFAAYCEAARAMGFDGVGLVHPRQIAIAHRAFDPGPAELEEARRIVAALEEAASRGLGVASIEGKMIDAPVAERARRVVARASGEAR